MPASNLPYFSHPDVVLEYARAAVSVGLWESERVLCERFLPKDAPLLELGCGAGRVALALARAGWSDITATDFAPAMIDAAREVAATLRAGTGGAVRFAVADATALPFADASFASAIFAFNGLFMLPAAAAREGALREIRRVLRAGGVFIFTAHARDTPRTAGHWRDERRRWCSGAQDPALEAFGDYRHSTPRGDVFIRAAAGDEIRALAERCAFSVELSAMRSEIAPENERVREFSDDTRFWVLRA
ncbi:MAG: class I SAM-dependent methyltransferase [Puniceicoccales bacterium]|jgi:ubiquinone/menaquinone biosynthesis C-methylase UbiE|nr:class I SAM-dependent methyltransferase [Puniceicoccales bacterium]